MITAGFTFLHGLTVDKCKCKINDKLGRRKNTDQIGEFVAKLRYAEGIAAMAMNKYIIRELVN